MLHQVEETLLLKQKTVHVGDVLVIERANSLKILLDLIHQV